MVSMELGLDLGATLYFRFCCSLLVFWFYASLELDGALRLSPSQV